MAGGKGSGMEAKGLEAGRIWGGRGEESPPYENFSAHMFGGLAGKVLTLLQRPVNAIVTGPVWKDKFKQRHFPADNQVSARAGPCHYRASYNRRKITLINY